MKDTEFIELLNLYLDHEISSVDAARLEAEVRRSAERRQLYQQYCRMQKACTMLAADFQSEPAVSAQTLAKKVVAFESAPARRTAMRGVYAVGAMAAAAACVAVIFSGRNRLGDGPEATQNQAVLQTVAVPTANPSDAALAAASTKSALPASGIRQRPMLVGDPLLLAGRSQARTEFTSAVAQENDQLAWVRSLELAPLQQRVLVEDLRFDARPSTLRPDARTLGGSQSPADAPTEMSAFRFVR